MSSPEQLTVTRNSFLCCLCVLCGEPAFAIASIGKDAVIFELNMAVPKKGWRKITVDSRRFYWRTNGTDWGISLVVVTDNAFIPDKTSQQLKVNFDYDHLRIPLTPRAVMLRQQAVITPKIVRLAIEKAIHFNPVFTGECGTEDVVLNPAIVQELQQQARITLGLLL